jgi:hypothetical protein
MMREARVRDWLGTRSIYTASQDPQIVEKPILESEFEIGPSEKVRGGGSKKDGENVGKPAGGSSPWNAWREKPKKGLKRPGARVRLWWKGC